jgi:hypothetical protein
MLATCSMVDALACDQVHLCSDTCPYFSAVLLGHPWEGPHKVIPDKSIELCHVSDGFFGFINYCCGEVFIFKRNPLAVSRAWA